MLTKKSRKIVADEICASVVYLIIIKDMTLNDALAGMHAEIMTRMADAFGPCAAAETAADIIRQIETMPADAKTNPPKPSSARGIH